MEERIGQNRRRAAMLVGAFMLVIVVVLSAVNLLLRGGIVGFVVAVVIAAVLTFAVYWKSDSVALSMSRAQPAARDQYSRLHNLVEGLCVAAGLPKPRLFVIDDAAPNAFATGRNPDHAAIAVTTGLLEKMNRVELEGVLAHELGHIKSHDTLVSTLAVTIIGVTIVPPFAPLTARLLQRVVPANREELADLSGVGLTRYPPGLIAALEKVRDDQTVSESASRATAHLWIDQAGTPAEATSSRFNPMFDTHPPLAERIELLREL